MLDSRRYLWLRRAIYRLIALVFGSASLLDKSAFGPVFLAGPVGLMLGRVAFGGISARYNRMRAFAWIVSLSGFVQLTRFAVTLEELLAITASEPNDII